MRILSGGPMCSLQRALMYWLVPLFLLVGAASAAVSYWTFNRMVASFMDDQMQQLGESIAHHGDRAGMVALDKRTPRQLDEDGIAHRGITTGGDLRETLSLPGGVETTTRFPLQPGGRPGACCSATIAQSRRAGAGESPPLRPFGAHVHPSRRIG